MRTGSRREAGGIRLRRRPGLVEALGEQGGEVAGDLVLEIGGADEREVGRGVVRADAVDQLVQALVAVFRRLDVDELRHRRGGEVVLVLESRDRLVGCDPAVALAVDADEDVGLREVGAVQLAGRMRTRAELEHDGGETQALDRRAHRLSLVGEFAQRRAHEHPETLVGRADRVTRSVDHRSPTSGTLPRVIETCILLTSSVRELVRHRSVVAVRQRQRDRFGEAQLRAGALAGSQTARVVRRAARRGAASAREASRPRRGRCAGAPSRPPWPAPRCARHRRAPRRPRRCPPGRRRCPPPSGAGPTAGAPR